MLKKTTAFLFLMVGLFAGMIVERIIYPRTNYSEVTEVKAEEPSIDDAKNETFEKISLALKAFNFEGLSTDRQEMKVTEPLDICINSQDDEGNYILGTGVTTRVLGDRPPDMPEMMHNYWLFKVSYTEGEAKVVETIPTFSNDCSWMNFEEHQREVDEIEEE